VGTERGGPAHQAERQACSRPAVALNGGPMRMVAQAQRICRGQQSSPCPVSSLGLLSMQRKGPRAICQCSRMATASPLLAYQSPHQFQASWPRLLLAV